MNVQQLQEEITVLKVRIAFKNSMIALLMADANLIDLQITELSNAGIEDKAKLRDLEAELKDTI